jgi:tartrate dehydrogenase/decarboxylase / D-malate dehydrogenase
MVLWDDVFKRVSADYPDVETESVLVDAMSAKFVLHPEDLSVVVASNLNADILSDLGGALAGSLGLARQGTCNPIGAIGSAALMLEHFGGGSASTDEVTDAVIANLPD